MDFETTLEEASAEQLVNRLAEVSEQLVVAALVVIGQGRWERMVAVLAGFLVGRSVTLRIWGRERS